MVHNLSLKEVEVLPPFPSQSSPIADGQYIIKCSKPAEVWSTNADIQSKIWFQTPPLEETTIRKIHDLQLFAESHDQGYVSDRSAGNWTWFELAILENEHAKSPRSKDGIELIWHSHKNRFETKEYGWRKGKPFGAQHDLVRLLEKGNVIAVRLCSRFPGWQNAAKTGYLSICIGKTLDRKPVEYKSILTEIQKIQKVITEVNIKTNAAFKPEFPKELLSAESFTLTDSRPLRVLSLDGGGVRGLSSLHLLAAVFEKAGIKKDPWEVFDMIGGTSTGGLIAIMLGRLKMSIQECIKSYEEVIKDVFPSVASGWLADAKTAAGRSKYSEEVLKKAIRRVVEIKLGDPDALLYDEKSDNPCKIFAMAVQKQAVNRGVIFLRSYQNPIKISSLPKIKIWEAARATSAAPTYFDPIKVDGVELLDGGLGANNPLGWLWNEVLSVFGPARSADCFLSLGTGIPPNVSFDNPSLFKVPGVVQALSAAATSTEVVHLLFQTLIKAYAPKAEVEKYWRMNVGVLIDAKLDSHGKVTTLEDYQAIGGLDDRVALKELIKLTHEFVENNPDQFIACGKALKAHL